MSVFVAMYMSCVNGAEGKTMQEILKDVVRPEFISRYRRNEATGDYEVCFKEIPNAVNLLQLDPHGSRKIRLLEEKEGFTVQTLTKYKDRLKKHGFRLVSTDEDGCYSTFSRPWNEKVLNDMFKEPVGFTDDGRTLWWGGNYRCNERIDGAISRYFPDLTFEVTEMVEEDVIAHYECRNGEIVKDYLEEEKACC